MPSILAIITARGGSKGIRRKNMASVGGKPLVAWTIEAALKSRSVSRVVVSTDDADIAAVAKRIGADAPFRRPKRLARDRSAHVPVVVHAVRWVEAQEKRRYDYVLLLQPTSPLRTAGDIDSAIRIAGRHDADAVVSVCASPVHPNRIRLLTPSGRLRSVVDAPKRYTPRQAETPAMMINGAIYLVKRSVLFHKGSLCPDGAYAYIMPAERSVDIDTLQDLRAAERLIEKRR
ncbi:MAG: acylneuraminate cytidylyltransferase family protein [Phycisphaerae bacterium]|nr:acylneuraminate cytidylyltransferase family protein [Phycisphaerae bacterium]